MRMLHRPKLTLWMLFLVLVAVSLLSLTKGTLPLSPTQVVQALFGSQLDPQAYLVIHQIRLPRLLLAAFVGAGLGVSGAAMQGLFRNPLADPALIGVSSGAALAAITVIVLGSGALGVWVGFWGALALPVAAFIGGALVTWVIYRLSTYRGHTDIALMLLTGVAINAIAGAGIGILSYYASSDELRTLTFWTMGSLASASWQDVWLVAIPVILVSATLPYFARALNAFLMGESVSTHIGFNAKRLKLSVIFLTALAVGAAVSVSGIVTFVGLVAPHLVRLLLGPDNRWLLPGSVMMGAILVVTSDMLARTLLSPAELPIGIVMAVLGGPFFLWMLIQRRSRITL